MTKHHKAVALLALAGVAATTLAKVDPHRFVGSPSEQLQQALDKAAKSHDKVVLHGEWKVDQTLTVVGDPFCTFKLEGSGAWQQLQSTADPVLRVVGAKRVRIEDLGILCPGAGIVFACDEDHSSSSQAILENVRVERKGVPSPVASVGFTFDGNGRDMCDFKVDTCEAVNFSTGFKLLGFNTLDMGFLNCQASGCDVGFDCSEGGACTSFWKCGGSGDKVFYYLNGGCEFNIVGGRIEDTDTIAKSTHDAPGPWLIQGVVADKAKEFVANKSRGVTQQTNRIALNGG